MAIELATRYSPYVDEVMKAESMLSVITNDLWEPSGEVPLMSSAKYVKIYKVGTVPMNDYNRNGENTGSRYGKISTLEATTEEFVMKKDRSFTFEIDKLDQMETGGALNAAKALNRQIREVIIPEVDVHAYTTIVEKAGTKNEGTVTSENIYDLLIDASAMLDELEIPVTGRYILVTPDTLKAMKKNEFIRMNEDIGAELRKKGIVAMLDGASVIRVPSSRLPKNFGFLYGHPIAAAAPWKLADYKVHKDPPGISGSLVEGRICYDTFVLDNKANALYFQKNGADA